MFNSLIVCTVIAHIFHSFHSNRKNLWSVYCLSNMRPKICWDKHIFAVSSTQLRVDVITSYVLYSKGDRIKTYKTKAAFLVILKTKVKVSIRLFIVYLPSDHFSNHNFLLYDL